MNQPTADLDLLSINQATTKIQWTLKEAINGYQEQGIHGISIWRDKLAEYGVEQASRHLINANMTVTGLCRGGMFTASTPKLRQVSIDETLMAVDEAAAINAQCLVIVAGGLANGSKNIVQAREQITEALLKVLPYARSANIPIAIEPLHPMYAADRSCINTMEQANDLCDLLGSGVGIAVDVYHVWWDPKLEEQIKRAGKERILGFHICDWRVPTRDLLLDRAMMGDGVIDIAGIHKMVRDVGYTGYSEVEIFSNEWWSKPAFNVVSTCKERYLEMMLKA